MVMCCWIQMSQNSPTSDALDLLGTLPISGPDYCSTYEPSGQLEEEAVPQAIDDAEMERRSVNVGCFFQQGRWYNRRSVQAIEDVWMSLELAENNVS